LLLTLYFLLKCNRTTIFHSIWNIVRCIILLCEIRKKFCLLKL
jgi:hypothetical protein